jgi:hypothetical protein
MCEVIRQSANEKPNHRHRRLLRARRQRPRHRCATEKGDEIASSTAIPNGERKVVWARKAFCSAALQTLEA